MIRKYIVKKETSLEFRNNTSLFLITPTMSVLIIVFPILSENRFRVDNDLFLIVELLFLISFAHLDATTVLSRQIAEIGIYPAVDPLDSTSRILDPRIVGDEHYRVAREVQKILQTYKHEN